MALVDLIAALATRIATEVKGKLNKSAVSAFGLTLIDDADAAAARTTLGLGALATKATAGTDDIADGAVTNAKLAGMTAKTLKGALVLGVPVDVTPAQLRDNFLPAGSVIDSAMATYNTNTDLTSIIPIDDTIPQITEGTQVLTVSITPKSATNKIRVRFQAEGSVNNPNLLVAALFLNAIANAVRSTYVHVDTASFARQITLEYEHTPGVTTEQTYRIRVGPGATGTARLNGGTTARFFGGTVVATLVVEEIKG